MAPGPDSSESVADPARESAAEPPSERVGEPPGEALEDGDAADALSGAPGSASDGREPVTFEWRGVRAGFLTCLPVALGVGGYGVAFGMLASQVGLSLAEATLMSALVVAGASQIVAVELWANPLPVAAIVLTTFAINLRYALMGAALQPWFRQLSIPQRYGSLFVMADENWALTIRDLRSGSRRGAFLLGSGIAVWLFWVGATVVGVFAGERVGDPAQYGLDFVVVAVFAALAAELWEGRSSLLPWLVALGTSVAAAELLPGRWYILIGGVAAAAAEVIRRGR